MKKLILMFVLFFLGMLIFYRANPVLAADPTPTPFNIKCSGNGIETALGCISTEGPTSLVVFLLRLALGIGGGIAFLLMLFGVFQIITSAGSPERLKAGQELITSALIGLMMIIFSIFLLQLIGVQILGLNAFGFGS